MHFFGKNVTHFTPQLAASLRGYTQEQLFADIGAGLTVGVVALPLSMAFAIASGLPPSAGVWTAIIAGFSSRLWAAARCKSAGQLVRLS